MDIKNCSGNAVPFKLATLSAAVAALPFSAAAADDVVVLPEVVVKAAKQDVSPTPLNESELGADTLQILRPATSDTARLLGDLPGVSLQGAGGVSSLPSIHGLADDRLRIKVDGMDLIAACPNHMNSPLSYIDPSAVETARVYAGVSPVSVGGDSIGGTIVVESAAPEFAKPGQGKLLKGEAGAYYRSNGNAVGGNLAATLASEQFSFNYTGAIAQSDNYTAGDDFKSYTFTGRAGHTLDLDEVGSTAYKSVNQAATLAWKGDTDLIEFRYGHQHVPYENFPNQRMDMTDNVSDQFSLAYTGKQGWGTLKGSAYYEHTEHEMDFGDDKRLWYGSASGGSSAQNGTPCSPISSTCAAGMPMYTDGKNAGLNLSADIRLGQGNTLRVGAEYQAYDLDDWWPPSGAGMWPETFWNVKNGERDRYALFGEWEARLNPHWTGLLGLRHETVKMDADDVQGYCTSGMCMGNQLIDSANFNAQSHDKTDHNWDLTALARYTPDATQTYEAGLAQKTRSPNLYERYTWSTWSMAAVMNNYAGDGNGYVGNLDLEPEVARTLSLAADWHDAGSKTWNVRVVPYYTYVRDYIDARCLPGTTCPDNQFNVLQYVNQSARLYGLDLSGRALVASTSRYGDFAISGLVSYVNGENRDTGDDLYNIMPLNAKLALTHTLRRWTNTLEAQFVAAKEDVSDVRNEIETDGYSLLNLRSSYEWEQVRLDVGIENLFDKGYALPLGGAYLGQGTTMSMNPPAGNQPQWGTAVPGMGRSIYAGVNVKF
jgi:iron complex outermembrane receptor protein